MKILVFTEKPFAAAAVKAIENAINAAGAELRRQRPHRAF